jgi:hypothetical protein
MGDNTLSGFAAFKETWWSRYIASGRDLDKSLSARHSGLRVQYTPESSASIRRKRNS